MLKFKNSDLRCVLEEAKANGCKVLLVKDHGVYMMSATGEKDDHGTHKRLAYAIGCNPNVDDFDDWWDTAKREFGGDDFVERFDVTDTVFGAVLNGSDDLLVSATATHIQLETAAPRAHT